jgi:alanyl-tRNA synthetase
MAREKGLDVDMAGFSRGMEAQKQQSRAAGVMQTGDWVELKPSGEETRFLGYEALEAEVSVVKYRQVSSKGKTFYQLVLDQTPFYAESGGQVGDRGTLTAGDTTIHIIDTQKENNLTVHIAPSIPSPMPEKVHARVDAQKRLLTANNHTATHLLHSALKKVLGDHVQQKGSLVNEERLRFDFAHFSKMTDEEILAVEGIVNDKIRENIVMEEHRELGMDEARNMGAVALFGEKYGDKVRVIAFDKEFSAELCGGTHVETTGNIGLFKIVSEGAIAAGIRRVEAITGKAAEQYLNERLAALDAVKAELKNPKDVLTGVQQLLEQNEQLRKSLDAMQKQQARQMVGELADSAQHINGVNYIAASVKMDVQMAKDLAFEIRKQVNDLFLVLGHVADGKPGITVMISENLVKEKGLHAGNIVRNLAKNIQGGGGGQPFFATAGGRNADGIDKALQESRKLVENLG